MVEGGGFEPPKAEPADLQSAPFGRSGTPPKSERAILYKTRRVVNINSLIFKELMPPVQARLNGARSRNRTNDLLITNQLLCQLSYAGLFPGAKMGAGFYAKHSESATKKDDIYQVFF